MTSSTSNGTSNGTNNGDKSSIADLVAKYGSASATAWLEMERYKIWRPEKDIKESDFKPVVGYMQRGAYVFAWANPLVSDSAALLPTAKAFASWAESQKVQPIWVCVDSEFEQVLGSKELGWSTLSCIYEDFINPEHVIDLTNDDADPTSEGTTKSLVKDLKKNLRRAERANVVVEEVKGNEWATREQDKKAVENGIEEWAKDKSGMQLASTTVQPWLDVEHRRYWVARFEGKIVGIIILTPVQSSFQIKNAISFPDAPKGTSEELIFTALKQLNEERAGGSDDGDRVLLTFGITASESFKPSKNLSGFRVSALRKTYQTVTGTAGLLRRGDFRAKFDPMHDPMYVCYKGSFGMDALRSLLSLLNNAEQEEIDVPDAEL